MTENPYRVRTKKATQKNLRYDIETGDITEQTVETEKDTVWNSDIKVRAYKLLKSKVKKYTDTKKALLETQELINKIGEENE